MWWNGLHKGGNEKRPGDLVWEILLKGPYELGCGRFCWLYGDFLKAMRRPYLLSSGSKLTGRRLGSGSPGWCLAGSSGMNQGKDLGRDRRKMWVGEMPKRLT